MPLTLRAQARARAVAAALACCTATADAGTLATALVVRVHLLPAAGSATCRTAQASGEFAADLTVDCTSGSGPSVTPTSVTPPSVTPTSVTPPSVTPTSVTPTSVTPGSTGQGGSRAPTPSLPQSSLAGQAVHYLTVARAGSIARVVDTAVPPEATTSWSVQPHADGETLELVIQW